jgi:hypothetical protein
MILIYALIVLLFGTAAALTGRRARKLERRYANAARQADMLAKELNFRGGNCVRPDAFQTAKRQYELGRLVQIRDRLEEKHHKWEARASKFRKLKTHLQNCKGRFLPYALGAVDVVGAFLALAVFGIVNAEQLRGAVQAARIVVSR